MKDAKKNGVIGAIETMTRPRVDNNQEEIVHALREVGAMVQPLNAVKCGCPDLLVAHHGRLFLMEVKDKDGRLTEPEWEWIDRWFQFAGIVVHIVRSVDGAMSVIGVESWIKK